MRVAASVVWHGGNFVPVVTVDDKPRYFYSPHAAFDHPGALAHAEDAVRRLENTVAHTLTAMEFLTTLPLEKESGA